MEKLILIKPAVITKQQALDYKEEHWNYGETILHGSALMDSMEYEDWLDLTERNSNRETVRPDWVLAGTFFVLRKADGRMVGMVDIRHELNDFLANYGGHIGYGVRPTERRKGYAAGILKLALEYAKSIGLDQVMLSCNRDNVGSWKTILRCGGKLDKEFVYTDGNIVQVYWIQTGGAHEL